MLAECVRMLWRRRILVIFTLLVTIVAGIGTYLQIQPGQESKAQVLLLGSIKQPGVRDPTNPFVNLGGSLAVVASVLQVSVTDEKTARTLYASGDRASYTVEPNLAENAVTQKCVSFTPKECGSTKTAADYSSRAFDPFPAVFFRVTARVLGPKNTVSYTQVVLS